MKLSHIDTEQSNPATARIDRASTGEILRLINQEDQKVALAVERVLPSIEAAVDAIYGQLSLGGRLIYIGCGTSGRLGVLDAVECPPTYGVEPELVMGLIAGGQDAFIKAKEGAEDDEAQGADDLKAVHFAKGDALVGIAASGRTPYVIGAMDYAKRLKAPVIALTCCRDSEISRHADITIAPLCGPEVVTGSTRMKSGTAEKLVLNMISTSVMIKLGKVYGNLMVDVKASNEKLRQRAVNIVMQSTGASEETAARAIRDCDGRCKTAIVSIACHMTPSEAAAALEQAQGHISRVMQTRGVTEA